MDEKESILKQTIKRPCFEHTSNIYCSLQLIRPNACIQKQSFLQKKYREVDHCVVTEPVAGSLDWSNMATIIGTLWHAGKIISTLYVQDHVLIWFDLIQWRHTHYHVIFAFDHCQLKHFNLLSHQRKWFLWLKLKSLIFFIKICL